MKETWSEVLVNYGVSELPPVPEGTPIKVMYRNQNISVCRAGDTRSDDWSITPEAKQGGDILFYQIRLD